MDSDSDGDDEEDEEAAAERLALMGGSYGEGSTFSRSAKQLAGTLSLSLSLSLYLSIYLSIFLSTREPPFLSFLFTSYVFRPNFFFLSGVMRREGERALKSNAAETTVGDSNAPTRGKRSRDEAADSGELTLSDENIR